MSERAELRELARGISGFAKLRSRSAPKNALPEQPFDALLLKWSALFRRSRELYLRQGGRFEPALVSSPRTLSSVILLEDRIQYSPTHSELVWSATDPREKRNLAHLGALRSYTASLFHEQNHRILWKLLPPVPRRRAEAVRFLNYIESLVVAADMALADALGPERARVLYLAGAIYDPGTSIRREIRNGREYRNYLQAAVFATSLYLGFYEPRDILAATPKVFPELDSRLAAHAARRALRLDPGFVHRTNPDWQRRHLAEVIRVHGGTDALVLPPRPAERGMAHLHAERWFDLLKID